MASTSSVYVPRDIIDTFDGHANLTSTTGPARRQALIGPTNRDDFRQSATRSWCRRISACRAGSCRVVSVGSVGGLQHGCGVHDADRPGTFGADPGSWSTPTAVFRPTARTRSARRAAIECLELQFAIRAAERRPYGRTITVRADQGNATVIAQPRGDFELPARNDLGIRIGKDLKFSAGQMLRLSLDIQNLFNNDTPLSVAINSSQATYGETTSISLPRRALVGIRYSF